MAAVDGWYCSVPTPRERFKSVVASMAKDLQWLVLPPKKASQLLHLLSSPMVVLLSE